ncbi:MAG: nickel-dependent hydrogenase large subunit [Planctomycetes bacterium]|nr:nickel-dependent hydrogenase large subunit [Planctomycetota bacterium]
MSEARTLEAPSKHSTRRTLNVPLNRVEGDLEIRVELDSERVTDAWSAGTMYRGFEQILKGRAALDGLVITPRICGICSTAHLTAAARALDSMVGGQLPPDAIRVRNLALMTEMIQSDVRQTFLMFAVDFANPAYSGDGLFDEAVRRYRPFQGETVIEVIRQTKKALEIVAILGGQWPHSSYMVPGGVASTAGLNDLLQCRHLLDSYQSWYEQRILGCRVDRWRAVRSSNDLDTWLAESPDHRDSDLGFYIRFARQIGLEQLGCGYGNFISFGALDLPAGTEVCGLGDCTTQLIPAGFARGTQIDPFEQDLVAEHVACSWFEDYDGGRHPFDGETRPCAGSAEGQKYSWAKAPRYAGLPAETGPLAELIISRNPLFVDLVERNGPNAFVRQLARLVRPAELVPAMRHWLAEIEPDGTFYTPAPPISAGSGFGGTQAARGALGHWVQIADGQIERYQIITPTAWNGSPRDSAGVRGPWEQALLGTPVRDPANPVELGHVVRSFDPCLVCTVHTVKSVHSLVRKKL